MVEGVEAPPYLAVAPSVQVERQVIIHLDYFITTDHKLYRRTNDWRRY